MPPRDRHFGLDWLRIAAFGVLILYHIGMAFAPWDWVVKTDREYPALIAPMAAVTPWRLALLFAVSGYASAMLLARIGDPRRFARDRSTRLLVPLAFGMAAVVPVEMWVRVLEGGYPHGYLHFWLLDSWRWGRFWGVAFPSWEHLWFVAYLWLYTVVLALALAIGGSAAQRMPARLAGWFAVGPRLLWWPIAGLVTIRLALLFVVPERAGLFSDWSGHAQYVPMFAFGFVLARVPALWRSVHRWWASALAIAIVTGAVVIAVELAFPGKAVPSHAIMAIDRAARVAMAWSMVLLLFHFADRYLNRDHRWRLSLGRAVFPAYIVHHPVIVAVTWFTLPLHLNPWVEAAILLAATLAACAATYLLARAFGPFGMLVGVPLARPVRRGGTGAAIC